MERLVTFGRTVTSNRAIVHPEEHKCIRSNRSNIPHRQIQKYIKKYLTQCHSVDQNPAGTNVKLNSGLQGG
jgi:hypothetical protein